MVSAFTGLGAPHWDMYARGAIVGLTRGCRREHIARAALEGIAYQVKDLLDVMENECGSSMPVLKVDGGASVSRFMMQFQSDILRRPIDRPQMVETTAFGAAFLAGLATGVWDSIDEIGRIRRPDRVFMPQMDEELANSYYQTWKRALVRAQHWAEP